jgi:hypothetical protein
VADDAIDPFASSARPAQGIGWFGLPRLFYRSTRSLPVPRHLCRSNSLAWQSLFSQQNAPKRLDGFNRQVSSSFAAKTAFSSSQDTRRDDTMEIRILPSWAALWALLCWANLAGAALTVDLTSAGEPIPPPPRGMRAPSSHHRDRDAIWPVLLDGDDGADKDEQTRSRRQQRRSHSTS